MPTTDVYREAEKRWRHSLQEPGEELIDFELADDRVRRVELAADAPDWLRGAQLYALCGVDGFRFLRCPFSPEEELRWSHAALAAWTEPEASESNLDLTHAGERGALWAQHEAAPSSSALRHLSWVTLGYHYQWSERRYDEARRSPFPPALGALGARMHTTARR